MESVVGVDHVGIGVRDPVQMKDFYSSTLGFIKVLGLMPEEDHPALHGLLRASRTIHSSMLLAQETPGLTLALFHSVEPPPRAIRTDARYGDIGVAKLTFAVDDLTGFCSRHSAALGLIGTPMRALLPSGEDYRFVYGRDPEGNLIELASCSVLGPITGDGAPSLRSVGIAVTDLDRSLAFYRDTLRLDRLAAAPHAAFSGLVDEVTGQPRSTVRSCLVGSSKGRGMLELLETTRPRGRSIPFGTQWGDFGYLQVCLAAGEACSLGAEIEAEGVDVLLPPQVVDDPQHPATFMYVRDPDGIPVEILAMG